VLLLPLAGLVGRLAQDGLDAEEDPARLGRAALVDGGALDVVEVRLGAGQVRLDREDRVRVARREGPALGGGPGLQYGRAPLRRGHDVERAARAEEPADVLDPVHLGGIGEDAPLAVHHHRVRLPAVPELAADLDELVRALVALRGGPQVLAVVRRLVVVERGDHIPGSASPGQVVEGGPEARGVVRVRVADRERGAQPDARRRRAHPRQQRDRVVLGHLGGVPDGGVHRPAIGVGDVVEVGEEDHVELAALADPRDVLVELGARPVVPGRRRPRMPPHGEAVIRGPVTQELRQVHGARLHGNLSARARRARRRARR
jgi:hypothetical protein